MHCLEKYLLSQDSVDKVSENKENIFDQILYLAYFFVRCLVFNVATNNTIGIIEEGDM